MKTIVLFGAGRSSTRLIQYIQTHAATMPLSLVIADRDEALLEKKRNKDPHTSTRIFSLDDDVQRETLISMADLVISMMPAHLHGVIARDCVRLGKHMLTASYVSDEMQQLDEEAKAKGVLLLNEMGVDPGIDHLSAMKVLDELRGKGAEITCFESFTGGLPAPGLQDNPWDYFFSWNPRNVVLAGSGGAVKFRQEGKYKFIPYHQLFRRTEIIQIPGFGRFEGYPNRDSLRYRRTYGLEEVPTIFRGTFRRPGFCRAWDVFVKLGMTDDSYDIINDGTLTHREFVNLFLAYHHNDSVELKLMHYLNIPQDSDIMEKLEWLGLFEHTPIAIEKGSPAFILEQILHKKWTMQPDDRDMIVMLHKIGFRLEGKERMMHTSMVYEGKNASETAMSDTVGLPLGIAARLILSGVIQQTGVCMPVTPDIYEPMLKELHQHGISFTEREIMPGEM